MSMLAFGKKGTRRPPLFQRIMHPRHTSPHLFWPLARKTLALIVCDGFSPGNKTREDEEDTDQTKDGRDGMKRWRGRRGNEGGNKAKWKRVWEERAKKMWTD